MFRYSNIFFQTICLFILVSCKSISPQKPTLILQNPKIEEKQLSIVNVPIELNLDPIFFKLENEAPKKMTGSENQCEGVSFSYRFEREPILFLGKKDVLNFTVDGKYALKVNYCPKCSDFYGASNQACVIPRVYLSCGEGEPMRRIRMSFDTKLSLTSDFKIQSKTILESVKTIDPCEVSFINYDATSEVLKEVEKSLKNVAKDLDKQIQATQIKSEVDKIWSVLSKPIPISSYGFLYIQPQNIFLSEPSFYKNNLNLMVGLEALPSFSTNPLEIEQLPLPKLSKLNSNSGFSINLDLLATYDSLNRILEKNITGQTFQIKNKKVIINKVTIFGTSNEKLVFEILFSGSKSGILYLKGTPIFENQTLTLRFKDVQFDIETKDILLKSAKWLFSDKITSLIESNALYSFEKEMNDLKSNLNVELNKFNTKEIKLEARLDSFEVRSIAPTEKQLIIFSSFAGDLKVKLF